MSKNSDKIEELLQQIETGTKAVFQSEAYRKYLTAMSHFHHYSFRNSLLIYLQNPDASLVAGYNAWQRVNRSVKRGEKGLQIIAPAPKTIWVNEPVKDSEGKPVLDETGRQVYEKHRERIPAYKAAFVFDVSQTVGEPLPEFGPRMLEGEVEDYEQLMEALRSVSPLPIRFEPITDSDARGYCSFSEGKIVVREGMSPAQSLKTAVHEISHAFLHDPAAGERPDQRTREVEAESTAFIVCSHYGLDTSDYTFPYLAGWSSSQELEQLHASLDRIQHQADELIQRVDAKLLELQKEVPERSAAIEQTVEQDSAARAQLIGTSGNTAYYVFPDGLTMDALADIKTPADSYVMIAPTAHLSEEWMQQHHIRFLKTGRDVETQELQTPEKLIARLQQNKALRSSAFDHLPDGRLTAVGEAQLQTIVDIDLRDYGHITEYTNDLLSAEGYTYAHDLLVPKIELLSFEQDDIGFYAHLSVAGTENRCMMRQQGEALYVSFGPPQRRMRYDLTDEEAAKYRAFEASGRRSARLEDIEIRPRSERPVRVDANPSRTHQRPAALRREAPRRELYTEEQIERAASTDLKIFLERQGEKLLKSGRESRLDRDHSVTVRGNQWFDHSENRGGNAITFVQRYYDLSFPEAVKMLLDGETAPYVPESREEPPPKIFEAPEANKDMRRVYAYLSKTRGIPREIIDVFAREEKTLYEDARHHNAVFLGRDENGVARHAHARSTNSEGQSFRINVEGSDARYSFHHIGRSQELYVFEAPIDLMSFLAIHPDQWQQHSYVACCGLSTQALQQMLKMQPEIRTVHLCLDNDEAGQRAADRIGEELTAAGYAVRKEIPKLKDWNEDLVWDETEGEKTEEVSRSMTEDPMKDAMPDKGIDLVQYLPPVRTQAKTLPDGWAWVDFHDGSGHLESPDKSFEISYDRNVRYFGDPAIEYQIGSEQYKPFFGSFSKFKEWAEGEAQRLMTEPQHTPEHDRSAEPDKEKMTVLVVEPMQAPRVATIESGLESLQEAVGGYIEAVYPFEDPVALVCNEEGKLDGLPLNRGLYDAQGHLYDIISGTFLVVGLSEESFGSLTPEQIEKYTEMYRTPQTFAIVNGTLLALPVKETAEIEAQRRMNERLDAVKFDNDIDLDKEKTRAQLGFRDQDPKPAVKSARSPMKERLEKAVSEAAHRASEAVKQKVTDRKMEVKDRC